MSEDMGYEGVPGLRYVPRWLDEGEGERLLALIDAAEWSAELRRRVQHYGRRYDYGRRAVTRRTGPGGPAVAPPLPGWARELAARLVAEGWTDRPADQVIVNEYLPGQGISPHVDCVPCFGPVVASVSLGSPCVMDFTLPHEGRKVAVPLAPDALCAMTGPARYAWRHGIAARKSDPGPVPGLGGRVRRARRVSVTFRTLLDGADEAA